MVDYCTVQYSAESSPSKEHRIVQTRTRLFTLLALAAAVPTAGATMTVAVKAQPQASRPAAPQQRVVVPGQPAMRQATAQQRVVVPGQVIPHYVSGCNNYYYSIYTTSTPNGSTITFGGTTICNGSNPFISNKVQLYTSGKAGPSVSGSGYGQVNLTRTVPCYGTFQAYEVVTSNVAPPVTSPTGTAHC